MKHLRPAVALIVLVTLVCGLAFPAGFVAFGHAVFPFQADGSLLTKNNEVVGSALLGQNFARDEYFWPRPSATTEADPKDSTKTISVPYAADNSVGSNLAPTSKALVDRVTGDVAKAGPKPVPGDAVTTSASGLDPDISPQNADRQVARVAATRKMTEDAVRQILAAHIDGRIAGLIGEPRVNVLALNMALDAAKP